MSYCDERPVYPVDDLPWVIPVGVQTSKGVEEIGFNVSAWLDKWPDMTFEVWPTRPTETAAYPAVCQLIGDVLVWYVSDADTAFEGLGTVEVVGIAEGIRKPSGPCTTEIKKTSLGVTKEPPEGIKPYYDDMMEAAKVIKENVDVGTSGLYIVRAMPDPETYNIPRADRTQEEIRAAVSAGKTVLLVYSCVEGAFVAANEGRVFAYAGEIIKDNGSTCPTFEGYLTYRKDDSNLLMYWKAYVKPNGTVGLQGDSPKTRTPHKLKLTGVVTAEFDGSEEVTVNIPQGGGVSDPGTAHQQLVSDADGTAVWVDRLAYPYTGQVEVLSETALTYAGEEDGMQAHVLTTSLLGVLEEGKTYQVAYNGTAYDCPVVSADGGLAFVLGNASAVGSEGGNPDAPFALIVYNDAETVENQGGIGGICAALDGATSVTISISTAGEKIVKLPQEYYDQGDWSALHTEPGHILNRTHWEKEVPDGKMVFDPAKVDEYMSYTVADGVTAYKISDIPMTQDTLDGLFGNASVSAGNSEADTHTWDGSAISTSETNMFSPIITKFSGVTTTWGYLLAVYHKESSFSIGTWTFDGIAPGTYILAANDALPYVEVTAKTVVKRLDRKYGGLPNGTSAAVYLKWNMQYGWTPVTIDQLKADLGLTSGDTTTEDVFYTSDGQNFTTLDGAVLHVQKGEE